MRLFNLVSLLVVAAMVVVPLGMVLAQEPNPMRVLPDTVEQGETFNVTVTFTAPVDNFAPGLIEVAPDGWNVSDLWCNQTAEAKATDNMAEYNWLLGPYANGTNFTVLYKVTVPCGASGNHSFFGQLYHGYNYTPIAGDSLVEVKKPAICFTPASIIFYAAVNGTKNETLELWSSTPCMLIWNSSNVTYGPNATGWLSQSITSGSCTYDEHSFVNLSVNSSGMSVEDYFFANITINATGANNSPENVPVTLHITDKGILKGQVSFTGRGSNGTRWIEPFVVRFFNTTTKVEAGWSPINVTTDAYGKFTIEDIYPDTYDIGIKNCTSLSMVNTSVTFTEGNITVVHFGTPREGDADGNDYINIYDFSLFSGAYDSWNGSAGWDPNCDFTRDGSVNIYDFSLLSVNYDKWGDLY